MKDDNFKSFQRLKSLKTKLKQQFLLLSTEQQQKQVFQKKLQNIIFSFYKSKVSLQLSSSSSINKQPIKTQKSLSSNSINLKQKSLEKEIVYQQQNILLKDQGFGDSYTFVKEILLNLSKNPYLMMILIEKNQNKQQQMRSLVEAIVNSMYQNIVDDDFFQKDFLKIIIFIFKKTINGKKKFYDFSFTEQSFINNFLTQILQRNQIKNYAKQVIKNTFLQIGKIDHIIDYKDPQQKQKQSSLPNLKSNLKLHKNSSSKMQESPVRKGSQVVIQNKKNKLQKSNIRRYGQALRQYDQKFKKGMLIKKKYRNCVSQQLLSHLGISQQIIFPWFDVPNTQQFKIQQQINRQLGMMILKNQKNKQNNQDSIILKNIVLVFFNDLFKMLYSMPQLIRICCRIMYRYLIQFYNNKNSTYIIADFIINFWLANSLKIDASVALNLKLSPYMQKNIEQVILVIRKIVKDNSKDIHQGFIKQFNILVSNLKVSISNYVNQIININCQKINSLCQEVQRNLNQKKCVIQPSQQRIKSYCVCISVQNIRKILNLIKQTQKQLHPFNDKLIKRVQRIQLMSQGTNIFGDKKDKSTGKIYKGNKAYVLFSELALPPHLSVDYLKKYNTYFKNDKLKNVMKQVLLALPSLQSIKGFYSQCPISDFIKNINVHEGFDTLNSSDRIPLQLKIDYLKILSKNRCLEEVIDNLLNQTDQRFHQFLKMWERSKECYLRAFASITFQNQKLLARQKYIRNQIKRRKLQQFFNKHQIKLCLTSPKTRQKQIVLKTTLMKQVIQQYKDKLWLQNQSKCIHTALNLDFIKSLTGQPALIKKCINKHLLRNKKIILLNITQIIRIQIIINDLICFLLKTYPNKICFFLSKVYQIDLNRLGKIIYIILQLILCSFKKNKRAYEYFSNFQLFQYLMKRTFNITFRFLQFFDLFFSKFLNYFPTLFYQRCFFKLDLHISQTELYFLHYYMIQTTKNIQILFGNIRFFSLFSLLNINNQITNEQNRVDSTYLWLIYY